ncbi:efflux RND transporter periplasmic adaptor subunit [bacterium]|nr:efflux RND transporter periplasmic adaptor subunit [bacterium]
MKKLLIGLVLGLLIAWLWQQGRPLLRSSPADRRSLPTTARAEPRSIKVVIEAVGEINPANLVNVKPEVPGRIEAVHVHTGQTVPKDALLVSLDDSDLRTEHDRVRTEIASAQVQLAKAERDHARLRDLFATKLVSQEESDDAHTILELARNDHDKTLKDLQAVEDKLRKIRILAPFAGTVLNVFVSEGQVVSGASGVSQGTELMTFASLDEMILRVHINQVDITKLAVGQAAEITVDSLPGVVLTGEVALIAPLATVRNAVKGFSVDVQVTRSDSRVRPGMNAHVSFPVTNVTSALSVPLSAVFAEGTQTVVYLTAPTGATRRVVQLGVADLGYTQVTNGLAEGETVLLQRPD